jgi:hypothetical protein
MSSGLDIQNRSRHRCPPWRVSCAIIWRQGFVRALRLAITISVLSMLSYESAASEPIPASPPKGLTTVKPTAISKADPIPAPASPPAGLTRIKPTPLTATRPVPAPAKIAKPKPSTGPKVAAKSKPKSPSRSAAPRKAPRAQARPQTAALPPSQTPRKSNEEIRAAVLAPYIEKYRQQLKRLKETFTPRHPDVVAIQKILDQLNNKPKPLSKKDRHRIRRQIASCWSLPAGHDANDLPAITLLLALDPEGNAIEIRDEEPRRVQAEPNYRDVSETAKKAIQNCSPLWLPRSGFQSWRSLVLRLDPKEGRRQ